MNEAMLAAQFREIANSDLSLTAVVLRSALGNLLDNHEREVARLEAALARLEQQWGSRV